MSDTSSTPELDHVVVNVHSDLDASAIVYEKLGFLLTERGHHSLGSSNNLAIFGRTYLELLGYLPGRDALRPGLWVHPAGLSGLVFKSTDPKTLYEDLKSKGLPALEPLDFSRPVNLPSGPRNAEFTVVRIDSNVVQNGSTFFCCHHTPDLIWRPEWQNHPNGVTDIVGFIVAATDPARTAAPFLAMFGAAAFSRNENGLFMQAGTTKVEFLRPETVKGRFQGGAPVSGDDSDRMVAISLRTQTPGRLREILATNAVQPVETPDGGVVVPYENAAGVALHFVS